MPGISLTAKEVEEEGGCEAPAGHARAHHECTVWILGGWVLRDSASRPTQAPMQAVLSAAGATTARCGERAAQAALPCSHAHEICAQCGPGARWRVLGAVCAMLGARTHLGPAFLMRAHLNEAGSAGLDGQGRPRTAGLIPVRLRGRGGRVECLFLQYRGAALRPGQVWARWQPAHPDRVVAGAT